METTGVRRCADSWAAVCLEGSCVFGGGGGVIEAPPSQHTLQKRNLGFMLLCVIFWSYYNYVIYECLAHCLGLQTEPGSDRGDSVNTKHENNNLKKSTHCTTSPGEAPS